MAELHSTFYFKFDRPDIQRHLTAALRSKDPELLRSASHLSHQQHGLASAEYLLSTWYGPNYLFSHKHIDFNNGYTSIHYEHPDTGDGFLEELCQYIYWLSPEADARAIAYSQDSLWECLLRLENGLVSRSDIDNRTPEQEVEQRYRWWHQDLPPHIFEGNTIGLVDLAFKNVAISGLFDAGPKCDIRELLQEAGARLHDEPGCQTDYLILGDDAREWKVQEANSLGVKVIDEYDLYNSLSLAN